MANTGHILKNTSNSVNNNTENTSDDEYLKETQSKFEGIEFPSDFDAWTVQEQRDWMYYNTELYQSMPETLQNMILAIFRPVDISRSQEKLPAWMDIDKYRRGQKFVHDNYFSFIFSILLGTIYSLTFNDGLKPLIISGQSSTPYLAFKRYFSTITRILSWYNGEPWIKGTKAYINMHVARAMHLGITTKMSQMSNEQIVAASKIADPLYLDRETFPKDIAMTCPLGKLEQRPYKMIKNLSMKAINNGTISVAQGSFIIISTIYPQKVGIYDATDENLEAFCHMWKCYGYFLGLEDEYNFCRGSLEEIKQRLWDLDQYWIKNNFTDATPEWMHMTRCIIESMNYYPLIYMPHKTMTLLFTEALNIEMPNLYASLSYGEWITYNIYKFLFRMLKFSVVRKSANRLIHKLFERASNFGPESLAELQEKSTQYLLDSSNK